MEVYVNIGFTAQKCTVAARRMQAAADDITPIR